MSITPNQHLFEYRIDRVLGQGAFGTVYLAYDTLLERPVAIKQLNSAVRTDETAFKRFLQEARTAGNLDSPNIVTVYALKVQEPHAYLVTEYVAGGNVRDLLEDRGRLPVEQAVQIAADVCEGLAAAHAKGIVHRDIKPENVLLTEDGRAKVGDFGIAHVPHGAGGMTLTQAGFQPGTLAYMSPEQVRGERVDWQSDVYQVGVLLYEMLAGRHYVDFKALMHQARAAGGSNPVDFQARLLALVSEAICGGRPPIRAGIGAPLPESVVSILDATLRKRSAGRPKADVLMRALHRSEELRPSGEAPPSGRGHSRPSEYHLERSVELVKQGQLESAIRELRTAARMAPSNVGVRCKLGAAYLERLRVNEAIAEFRTALTVDPDHVESHWQLGEAQYAKGNLVMAIEEYKAALALDPACVEAYAGLGKAYRFEGELEESARAYEAALGRRPRDPALHYNLALVYTEQRRPEAEREMATAAKLGFVPAKSALERIRQVSKLAKHNEDRWKRA